MRIIMFTPLSDAAKVLPATSFLDAHIECLPAVPSSYATAADADVVLLDARGDLVRARALCQLLTGPMSCGPVMLVLEEGGAAVAAGGGGDCEFGGFAVVGGDSHDGRVVVKQEMVVLGVGESAEELFGEGRDAVVAGGSVEDGVNGGKLVGVKFACDGEFHAFQA